MFGCSCSRCVEFVEFSEHYKKGKHNHRAGTSGEQTPGPVLTGFSRVRVKVEQSPPAICKPVRAANVYERPELSPERRNARKRKISALCAGVGVVGLQMNYKRNTNRPTNNQGAAGFPSVAYVLAAAHRGDTPIKSRAGQKSKTTPPLLVARCQNSAVLGYGPIRTPAQTIPP